MIKCVYMYLPFFLFLTVTSIPFPTVHLFHFLQFGFQSFILIDENIWTRRRRTIIENPSSVVFHSAYVSKIFCTDTNRIKMCRVNRTIRFTKKYVKYIQTIGNDSITRFAEKYWRRYIIFIAHRIFAASKQTNSVCGYICKYFALSPYDRLFTFLDCLSDHVFCVYCNTREMNCSCSSGVLNYRLSQLCNQMHEFFVEILTLPLNYINWHNFYDQMFFAPFVSSLWGHGHIVFSVYNNNSLCYIVVHYGNVDYFIDISQWYISETFKYVAQILHKRSVNNVKMCSLTELCISKIVCRILHKKCLKEVVKELCVTPDLGRLICLILDTAMLKDVRNIVNNNISAVKDRCVILKGGGVLTETTGYYTYI